MAVANDAYGLPVTSASRAAVDHYVHGVGLMLARNSGAEDAFKAAIDADAGLSLGHIALAAVHHAAGRATEAKAAAAAARRLSGGMSRREQQQVEAISTAVEGNSAGAPELAREHLKDFPRDAIVVRQLQLMLTASGRIDRKELAFAILQELAGAYGDDPWFLASYSFNHTEAYLFSEARRLADRSYALNPRSSDCAHSMAHVVYETGDHGSGSAFLYDWLNGSAWQAAYAGHLNWHLALFEFGRGEAQRAIDVYNGRIAPGKHATGGRMGLTDAASFLWRCELFGVPRPAGADAAVAELAKTFGGTGQAFPDVHKGMAFALADADELLGELHGQLQELVKDGRLGAGQVVPAVVEAVGEFARGGYEKAATLLEQWAHEFVRIGGSRAQFEVLTDTLVAAYLRSGRPERAAPLIRVRLERRPSYQDEGWERQLATTKS